MLHHPFRRYILGLLLLVAAIMPCLAQTVATDKESVIAEAKRQLTNLAAPEGELGKFCEERGIQGQFTFDITVVQKGNVITVFTVSSTVEDMAQQNRLKVKINELKFDNIKLPKNTRVKFQHTLNF
ncbi:MAG TPA: hypothetical protein PLX35_09155 [Cyclobacteriaceae bacterium]|nr:hypothetical protein [Cyclobacteriaceae bacterium]